MSIEDYATDVDVDDEASMELETSIGTMVAIALTLFVLGGFMFSPHAPQEPAASAFLLGP